VDALIIVQLVAMDLSVRHACKCLMEIQFKKQHETAVSSNKEVACYRHPFKLIISSQITLSRVMSEKSY